MKLRLEEILADDFLTGMDKIGKANLPMKTAFKLKDVTSKVKSETQKYRELVKDLFDKYGKKDKNGKIKQKVSKGKPIVELKDQTKWNKAHRELLDVEVELENLQIKFSELDDIRITPNEIYAISKVIDFVE